MCVNMASRTYVPTLKFLTNAVIKFVARYRVQIVKNLSEQQVTLLDILLDAAQTLSDALPNPVIGP